MAPALTFFPVPVLPASRIRQLVTLRVTWNVSGRFRLGQLGVAGSPIPMPWPAVMGAARHTPAGRTLVPCRPGELHRTPRARVPVRPRRDAHRQRVPARHRLACGAVPAEHRPVGVADPPPDRHERRPVRVRPAAGDRPHAVGARHRLCSWHQEEYLAQAGLRPPLPGAADLLAALTERKVAWAIATSGYRATAGRALALLGLPDDAPMVTRDMVAHAKPDPDLFLAAAALLGVDPGTPSWSGTASGPAAARRAGDRDRRPVGRVRPGRARAGRRLPGLRRPGRPARPRRRGGPPPRPIGRDRVAASPRVQCQSQAPWAGTSGVRDALGDLPGSAGRRLTSDRALLTTHATLAHPARASGPEASFDVSLPDAGSRSSARGARGPAGAGRHPGAVRGQVLQYRCRAGDAPGGGGRRRERVPAGRRPPAALSAAVWFDFFLTRPYDEFTITGAPTSRPPLGRGSSE